MEVYPIPAFKTKKAVNSIPYDAFGINSKCKYKKAAFEYIKKLLSEEFYKQYYNYNHYATVNNAAFEEELSYYSDNSKGFGTFSSEKGPFEIIAIPEKLSNQLKSTIANMHKCEFTFVGIRRIVKDDLKK